jgi:2-methylisocitrate lyase-like PEP mutase family enzyme
MTPAQTLRQLIARPGMLRMPGAYDALSARIIAANGFQAIVVGGYAATGSLLGEPDMGQMTLHDYADHYGRIAQAVAIPVFADADTGFGGPNNVRRCVRAFERAGVAGMFIEDQTFPKRCGYLPGKAVIPAEQMVAKIVAALDARSSDDFFFCARTDAAGVEGLDAAIERGRLYAQAGADMVMVQGADSLDDLQRVCREVAGPQLANASQARAGAATALANLEAAGAAAVMLPSLALYAAAAAVDRTMAALHRDDAVDAAAGSLMSLDRYNDLVGLDAHQAREERYDRTAAGLAADVRTR